MSTPKEEPRPAADARPVWSDEALENVAGLIKVLMQIDARVNAEKNGGTQS